MIDKLLASAREWIGTPYHHRARVKGVGVDCGQLIIAVHEEAGLVNPIDTGYYSSDWHLHQDQDLYLEFIHRYLIALEKSKVGLTIDELSRTPEFEAPPPGSVIVFRVGRTYSHGALISRWPFAIHAYQPSGIVEEVNLLNTPMSKRPTRFYIHEGLTQ